MAWRFVPQLSLISHLQQKRKQGCLNARRFSGFACERENSQVGGLAVEPNILDCNSFYLARSLTNWCRLRGLNPRPSVYKTAALPLS
jgi:hypothetical protein